MSMSKLERHDPCCHTCYNHVTHACERCGRYLGYDVVDMHTHIDAQADEIKRLRDALTAHEYAESGHDDKDGYYIKFVYGHGMAARSNFDRINLPLQKALQESK